ncbi:hypothetical protein [Thermosulfurimonas sp. F29]|uniref:hypothetical protein n=1 Tax=Thermosulfurimonas sp. F29 TaxID=2867247 RepID=UPI001C8378AA|nr:hypothetical protein [Thermosulfurimonas sp. F29]MBX6421996.1 hypothetical protein [Thermosulfurimonas sp. F29]
MIRTYKKQFESKKVEKIDNLIKRIKRIKMPGSVSKYYAHELLLCLQAGALLGSLCITSALLEIFVRELAIKYSALASSNSDLYKKLALLQKQLEEKRNLSFKQLINGLASCGLFSEDDAEQAKEFYDSVRIPIHHGLPARFVEIQNDIIAALNEIFTFPIGMHEFEEVIEDRSLDLIEIVIGIIERNNFK